MALGGVAVLGSVVNLIIQAGDHALDRGDVVDIGAAVTVEVGDQQLLRGELLQMCQSALDQGGVDDDDIAV